MNSVNQLIGFFYRNSKNNVREALKFSPLFSYGLDGLHLHEDFTIRVKCSQNKKKDMPSFLSKNNNFYVFQDNMFIHKCNNIK
jgi:hypothetical protein